jgi:hypothetical protein
MTRYSWLREGVEAAPITQNDLNQIEKYADKLFAKVGIDVEFTRHFLDRVNDERNQRQITLAELTRLFKQEYKQWGKKIAQLGPDAEAVMKDMRTDVNMPFVLVWDKNNQELDLVAKTVMRKKDFKTSNKEFAVESIDPILTFIQDKEKSYELSYGNCGALAIALDQKFDMDEFVYVTNDAEPDKLYHVAAVKNGKIYDADGITNLANVRARGLEDEYPDEEPQVEHVPAVATEYSYILKGTDPDVAPEDLLEDVTQAADLAMRFSQFSPEELAQLAIFLGVALPTLKAMFATYTGYRKLKNMIKKKLASESVTEDLNEESPYEMFKRYIAPKVKARLYKHAADTLNKVIDRKKKEKSSHDALYYAMQVAKSYDGVNYKSLYDYYKNNYVQESRFTEMELAIMEGGHSIDEADDPKDIISMDVPLFVRILELSRETIKTDADLHHVVSKIIDLTKEQDAPLDMKAYQAIEYVLGKDRVDEVLRKVKNPEGEMQWALVSKSNPKKVLQYYRGPKGQKPSEEWYNKVERRVQAFKHMGESSSESVNEIISDPHIPQFDSEPEDWDEYIGQTKKVATVKGYDVHFYKDEKYYTDHYFIKDPDSEGFLGHLTLKAFMSNYHQSSVTFAPEIQGKGLALPLYAYVVKKGYTLVSDKWQSKGSKESIWKKLATVSGIFVYAWDKENNEFFQWDPKEDLDSEIYHDQDKLDDLEDDYKAKWKELNNKLDADELSQEEYDRQFALLKDQYQKATDEEMQKPYYGDIRLVAIADKKKSNKSISEGGVGIITKQNTTQDVKPGETQRQAAKLGMKLDKNNEPPKLHKKAVKNSTPNKLFNLGIK